MNEAFHYAASRDHLPSYPYKQAVANNETYSAYDHDCHKIYVNDSARFSKRIHTAECVGIMSKLDNGRQVGMNALSRQCQAHL